MEYPPATVLSNIKQAQLTAQNILFLSVFRGLHMTLKGTPFQNRQQHNYS